MTQPTRQLAAILFTDIVGYTAMMQQDEQRAVSVNKRYGVVLKEAVSSHGGEILNDYGDGSLCTFASATQAVKCAMEMQQQLQTEPKVPLRIGLHIGEIFFEGGKVFGDGVNVASRIQSLGSANSVLFSSEINSKLTNQPEFTSTSIGKFQFKNVSEPMEVFALTNDGFVVPDKKKMEGKLQEKKSSNKKTIRTAALVLLAFVSYLLYRQFSITEGFTGKEKSIAVLPFETVSSEKENDYINDGFTIDVINKLSKLSGLSAVPGWARVKIFKNTTKALIEIANELGVAAILTGTIQKQADKLHISVELLDVNTGKTIWNAEEDRKWGDVLNLQSEVAQKIVTSLSAHLTPEDSKSIKKQYTENTEAYNYYIKGRYQWDKRSKESFDSAEANYKRAIDLDPRYALAYAGLADLYIYNQKGLTQLEAIPIARQYATKALSLDSNLCEALTTIGFIQSAFEYDWAKSKATLEKALHLNPNYAFTHVFYGNLLQYTGEDVNKGITEIKKALDLDPLSSSINWVLGRNYYFDHQYDLAQQQLRKTLELDPKNALAWSTLSNLLVSKKNYPEALEAIKRLPVSTISKVQEFQASGFAYAYSLSGDTSRSKQELRKILSEVPDDYPYLLARIYVGQGDFDQAMAQLEKAYTLRTLTMYFISVDPTMDPIRNDPRFKALLKKMGFK